MRRLLLAALALIGLSGTPALACQGSAVLPALQASVNNLDVLSNTDRPCIVQVTAAAAASITGLADGREGDQLTILAATGSAAITLVNASSSSDAANRLALGSDVVLAAGDSLTLQYNPGENRWRAVGRSALAASNQVITDLTVTGSTAFTSPFILGAAAQRIYFGTKTLTEAGGAETIFTITTATTQSVGGILYYRISATDATDYAARAGSVTFVCNNVGGTVTSSVSVADETGSVIETTNSKTLTYAITDSNAANTCAINFNIDSDMTTTANSMTWILILTGPGTVS